MLSRRSFLRLVGASLAATALHPNLSMLAAVIDDAYQGRAFTALPVYSTPNEMTKPKAQLWPDSITLILDRTDEWYQVSGGWVRRDGLQPMLPYDATDYKFINAAPFWAEVAAPVAPVRAFCAADAPLVTRIGHGGVSQVIDALPGEPNGWYGIADQNGDLLGWTQGVFWRPVEVETNNGDDHMLHIDRKLGLMQAYAGAKPIIEVPFAGGSSLKAGDFMTHRGVIGGLRLQADKAYEGVSWQTLFGDGQMITGIYWHNRFRQAVQGDAALQTTPLLARWLYGWLGDDAHIVVE